MLAISLLFLAWLIFFWRLFTPIAADQAAFKRGDFSGQFVAFGGYHYQRMAHGEIPLWNPYNNGGLPFIADTQAAVFYPPRLLTIALSLAAGEWTYNALQLEAVFHVLLYSLLMYLLVRRLTFGQEGSAYGAFIAAIVAAYGGFFSGYPPLQLAVLEANIWLPLALTGILEATRTEKIGWRCLVLAGVALGLSWLAGHPQTSWFLTYLLVAWLAYRVYQKPVSLHAAPFRTRWRQFALGVMLFGTVTFGITAVTLLPGMEYLLLTARTDLGFDAKGNGFPFQDVLQFVFPGAVSVFSPLYVGIPALILAFIAVQQRLNSAIFWLVVFIIGLLHSFGANSAFFYTLYNLLPGLRFFRGQERAALLVANSLAILAGMGAAYWVTWQTTHEFRAVRRFMWGLLLITGGITGLIIVGWLGNVGDTFGQVVGFAVFSTLILSTTMVLIEWHLRQPHSKIVWFLLATLIIFELFSVNMDADSNYDSVPAANQLSITPPALLQPVLDDKNLPFRVDGFRGVQDNYGSLYGVMDIRGISPLFLTSAQHIIYRDYTHNPLAWEVFAVKYVFSEREDFSTPTRIITEGTDRDGTVKLHQLENPRPFAWLLYRFDVVDSDEFARALLADPNFQPRNSVILHETPNIVLPDSPPENASAIITQYQPETFTVEINTPENAILSLAQVDYPGWYAMLDDTSVKLMRAYGGLTAVAVPAGEHTLILVYNPLSYRVGAVFSLVMWGFVAILAVSSIFRRR
jgi:hypothetical protein